MPETIEVEVDVQRRLIEVTVGGPLSLEFLWQVMAAVAETPDADPSFRLLFDGSALTLGESDARQLSVFEAGVPTHRDRLAIVAEGDLHYGFARMYEAWSEPEATRSVQVFRTRAEARDWLLEEMDLAN
ncbi:MAG: hypothetical protein AAF458_13590 [Pseudomonadota bacterium]